MSDASTSAQDQWVTRVLGIDPEGLQARAGVPTVSPVRLAKAALIWRSKWTTADRQLQALADAVTDAIHDDEDVDPQCYATVEARLRRVTGITAELNLDLADELDDLMNASPEQRAAPIARLRKQLDSYAGYLSSDPMIDLLEDNEFLPVSVKADLLEAVSQVRMALPS